MRLLIFALLFVLQCTTIGFHENSVRSSMDFGVQQEFKVCTYKEEGIDEEEISSLFQYWNEELSWYSLKAIHVDKGYLERPGFTGFDILNYLYTLPLTEGCDRILYLKGRQWKDILYEFFTLGIFAGIGIKLEMQGAVETNTNTRGYIKAKYISTLQILFTSPKSTLVHEGYHLLGCGHQLFMQECYEDIQKVKSAAKYTQGDQNFFPSKTKSGNVFKNRFQVNQVFGMSSETNP